MWWDSTRNFTSWTRDKVVVATQLSSIAAVRFYNPSVYGISNGVVRGVPIIYDIDEPTLFPQPDLYIEGYTSGFIQIRIPYYLIFLSYLAILTFAWLLLMNRLARQEAIKESRFSDRQD